MKTADAPKQPPPQQSAPPIAPTLPPARWWGRFVMEGNPPEPRFVLRWSRLLLAALVLVVVGYLGLASALWGYYSLYRKIPNVAWVDVVVLPRFSRVQAAVGAHHFEHAKKLWEQRDYVQSIMTARAALQKAPANLDARLFISRCWQQTGRPDEAVRVLRDGVSFHASDERFQKALIETCLATGRYRELLEVLRRDLPARNVRLLSGPSATDFQLAEVRAVLETAGVEEAEKAAAAHAGFADKSVSAPLLARIDWEQGRREPALAKLAAARAKDIRDPGIHDAYVDTLLRLGKADEARAAAAVFLKEFSNMPMAQLRFLEAHGSRRGADATPWMNECVRFLLQYQRVPAAMERLAILSGPQGWSDLAFLLYQNSLQENMTGFPFAIYYAASLVKAGNYREADLVWRDLSVRNSAQLSSASYVATMIAAGLGKESEAMQLVERLQRETVSEPRRRQNLAQVFQDFGFPKIAAEFTKAP